ncbi:MAG TPA: FAD-binding oxidoreductase [Gammaproteobacteria bacterium]|nr:FAD-binding oxidoreductase [Gammaproteobacteria bacterium]
MSADAALARIAAAVGPAGVLSAADAGGMLIDQRGLLRGRAALIVRPRTVEECAEVLRICNEARIGVVPQGGNTGLCGGATPFDAPERREILLSTARLDRVREIDTVGFTMTAEAGVVLAAAHEAARSHDLLLPLRMGSEGSAQLGGALSTNAGGIAVLRYGTMRDLVLGLEVVLPNGDVLRELKALRKDNTGYDLRALFVGAEGTLGLITATVLDLFPLPRSRETAWLAVASVEAACRVLGRARRASGDAVVSAEYVGRGALELVLKGVPGARNPFRTPHEHHLLIELGSADADGTLRANLERTLAAGLEAGEILDGVVAESGAQRDALWLLRERVPEAERHAGGSLKHDVAVRIARIPELVTVAERELAAIARCRLSVFGHVGDGNLHFNLLPPAGQSLADLGAANTAALTACIYDVTARLGGTFSAEHGVGLTKTGELARYESAEALALMHALKRALDPHGIMNPGKVLAR